MTSIDEPLLLGLGEDAVRRAILAGTAAVTGEQFFAALVKNLAQAQSYADRSFTIQDGLAIRPTRLLLGKNFLNITVRGFWKRQHWEKSKRR
jgi:hypothetical protein